MPKPPTIATVAQTALVALFFCGFGFGWEPLLYRTFLIMSFLAWGFRAGWLMYEKKGGE